MHHYLVRVCKRQLTGLIIETGEAREGMHFATLIGYGASAVNPYLALERIADLKYQGRLPESMRMESAINNYITAIKKGLLNIMSKMGVSTSRSYRGAQIFESFFPSRRRHTRYIGDWSSDVCSSDLHEPERRATMSETRIARRYGDGRRAPGPIRRPCNGPRSEQRQCWDNPR